MTCAITPPPNIVPQRKVNTRSGILSLLFEEVMIKTVQRNAMI